MSLIYILQCEETKYYIGKTNQNILNIFRQHKNGTVSEWTKKYTPIEIIDIFESKTDKDEDFYTKIYMKKYGINNVRGGNYITIDLPDYKIKSLIDEIASSEHRCFRCKIDGHIEKFCTYKTYEDDMSNNKDKLKDDNSYLTIK